MRLKHLEFYKNNIHLFKGKPGSIAKEEVELDDAELEKNTNVYNDIQPSFKINSEEEYERLQNTTDVTYLVYYYKRVHKKSQEIAGYLKNIATKLEYLGTILLIDCATKFGQTQIECNDAFKNLNVYPKIKALTPPLYRFNPYTRQMNGYESVQYNTDFPLTEINIYNFLTLNIGSRSSKLVSDNIDTFTG
jgi:hypothetical protein